MLRRPGHGTFALTKRTKQLTDRDKVRAAQLLFPLLFLMYLATATFSQRQNIDSLSTLVPAWSLASTGRVHSDDYAGFTPWLVEFHGHTISNRLPGAILWATPFYAVLGRGGHAATIYPSAVASAAAAALAVFALYKALLTISTFKVAWAASLLLALGTPTWSISSDALWTHGPAQMFLALSLWAYASDRLALGGLLQGACILVRPHLAVVAACMGLGRAIRDRRITPGLIVAGTSGLGVLGLLTYYRLVYGQWTLIGGYGSLGGYGSEPGLASVGERINGSTPFWENLVSAAVSPGRGLLVYTPFLLLLIPGVPTAWKHSPDWVRSAAVGGIAYTAVQLWNNGYSGEGFFAYRFMLEPLVLWAPLLTIAYVRWTSRRRLALSVFWLLAFAAVGFQAVASVSDFTKGPHLAIWTSTTYGPAIQMRPTLSFTLLAVAACVAAVVARRVYSRPR